MRLARCILLYITLRSHLPLALTGYNVNIKVVFYSYSWSLGGVEGRLKVTNNPHTYAADTVTQGMLPVHRRRIFAKIIRQPYFSTIEKEAHKRGNKDPV